MIKRLVLFAAIMAALLPVGVQAAASPAEMTLLVRFQAAPRSSAVTTLLRPLGATLVGEIPQLDLVSVSVPTDRAASALAVLWQSPSIAYAEPDRRAQAALEPNDPAWSLQWGAAKIRAPLAWEVTTGSSDVIVAVVDSGTTLGHPDLAPQLWTNPGEVPGNGLDDDGNGQVDDIWGWHFYHGWNGQTYVPMENNQVADDFGHGTHVAGIAAGAIDNGVGVAGIAGSSRIMTVKVLDENGTGWYSDIAAGIVYAVDNGARVVNLSLGGAAASQALQDAVDYARAHGVLVVAAAGNDGGGVLYPAACDHVLAVAATNPDDQRAAFSNYGLEVDISAPGVDIYSTWPWLDGYWTESGTSMATPYVAGTAALLFSKEPAWSGIQVGNVITRTAVDIGSPGWDPYTGWGRLDAGTAVHPELKRAYLPLVVSNLAITEQH